MTHKYFQSLALTLSYAKPSPTDLPRYEQWRLDVDMIATACALHSTHFDRPRFVEACEQDPKK